MGKAKILILDDDRDIIDGTALLLESKGYSVSSANDYDSGLAMLRSEKPDLLILDAMLMHNDKSGLQLPAEVRKDPEISHIPILMISAINDGNPGEEFSPGTGDENLPIDGFMEKPANPTELYGRVETLLKQGRSKWAAGPD